MWGRWSSQKKKIFFRGLMIRWTHTLMVVSLLQGAPACCCESDSRLFEVWLKYWLFFFSSFFLPPLVLAWWFKRLVRQRNHIELIWEWWLSVVLNLLLASFRGCWREGTRIWLDEKSNELGWEWMRMEKEGKFLVWTEAPGLSWCLSARKENAIWLILPVVICLSQRLSHAGLSPCRIKVRPRMAHYISYGSLDLRLHLDNPGNSRANTCIPTPTLGKVCFY